MEEINQDYKQWHTKVIWFLIGQGVSLFGSQLVQMAIIWYVTLETSSGVWVTILTLASFLPQMIISLFAGVWADRYDKKKVIILADGIIAAVTLTLALFMIGGLVGTAALPFIIVISAIRSLGTGVQTPTVNALLPQMVPEDNLVRVNGLNSTMQSVVQFVSPMAAGAIMAIGAIYDILMVDVITAVIGITIMVFIKVPKTETKQEKEQNTILGDIASGMQYTWNHRLLRKLLLGYGIFIFLCVPSGFLSTLMIERTFGNEVIYLTINEMVGFAGSLIGGILLGITGGFKNRNVTYTVGILSYAIATLFLGFTSVFWLYAVLMFVIGIAIPVAQTAVFTIIQEKAEQNVMGRVFSLLNMMFTGCMSLGMALFGPLADVFRIQNMVIVCSVLIFIIGVSFILTEVFHTELQESAPVNKV